MHINEIDLNLLRLFDAVYRTRNVSRAEAAVIAHLGSRGLWGLSAKEPETDGRG